MSRCTLISVNRCDFLYQFKYLLMHCAVNRVQIWVKCWMGIYNFFLFQSVTDISKSNRVMSQEREFNKVWYCGIVATSLSVGVTFLCIAPLSTRILRHKSLSSHFMLPIVPLVKKNVNMGPWSGFATVSQLVPSFSCYTDTVDKDFLTINSLPSVLMKPVYVRQTKHTTSFTSEAGLEVMF